MESSVEIFNRWFTVRHSSPKSASWWSNAQATDIGICHHTYVVYIHTIDIEFSETKNHKVDTKWVQGMYYTIQ